MTTAKPKHWGWKYQWEDDEHYQVAVFYPESGEYGGITKTRTLAEALKAVEETKRLNLRPVEVHIRRVRVERVRSEDAK